MKLITKVSSILLAGMLVFSCQKNDEKLSSENSVKSQISIRFKVSQNDKMQLRYASSTNEQISDKNLMTSYVIGSEDIQEITFDLPKNVVPKKIRLDVSENLNQTSISIQQIKIKVGEKEIIGDYMNYFTASTNLVYNYPSYIYDIKVVNNLNDAFLVSNQNLENELKKIKIQE